MEDDLNQARIDLAREIFSDAQGCTGSEVCQGMDRALAATDQATLDAIRAEFLDEDADGDEEEDGEASEA